MKRILLLALSILSVQSFADNDKRNVKSTIKQVTVFLSRAQINSTAGAPVEAGMTDVIIEGLPPSIDKQSIQVSGKGDFVIMSVKYNLNYVDPQQKSPAILALEDSMEVYQLQVEILTNMRDVYNKEEQMMLANQSMKGTEKGITADELEEMADLFRERLADIRTRLLKNEREIKKVTEKKARFFNQLNEINRLRNQPSSQIMVTVSAKTRMPITLDVQYIVTNAGWYPIYDLRAKDTKNPVQLNYKAQVFQNTGIDWEKVKLKLSTGNPAQGGTKPTLSTWWLQFYTPVTYSNEKRKMKGEYAAPSMQMDDYKSTASGAYQEKEEIIAQNVSNYTQVTETTLAAEFDIAIPYTIPSDGIGQLVDVKNFDLPASYKHFSVPKMDNDAFLVAQVTGWEDLNMLSGNANIYFEGTYVGEAYLDMQNTKDTLDLSLGRDHKVIIERKKLKDFSKKNMIGTTKKEEFVYEITVRNTKKDPIELSLEDQVPVSKDAQIEVEVTDTGGAEYDKESGKLVWKMNLNSAETKKVTFKYSVKYPKNKIVSGLY
ncbi:MAG: DUF4139 domain-containing protein [Cytophagaceae bacterium]